MENDAVKKRTFVKTLIVISVLFVLYVFIGNDFVEFYFGGKGRMLETADYINNLCNSNGCPLMLEGWEGENGRLRKGPMLYIAAQTPGNGHDEMIHKPQSFKLIYVMPFLQDDWFEAQGGVGKHVTSGWTGR